MTQERPKILIVDDVPANLVVLRKLLAKVPADIISASSGNEALALALDHEFALVLLDVQMPEMDGYEVAEWLQSEEQTRGTPIIFVTAAYKDDVHRITGYEAGAVDYIEKPIEPAILLSKVGVFLRLYQQKQLLADALHQLESLNENLEQRVRSEVHKNLEQERILVQQSRLAAMGEMIGNIAHQWRQPLNALGLLLANIKDANDFGELDTEQIENSVAKGVQLIDKMSTTIDDFRNFFKPNKEKATFSLRKAVQDTLEILAATFRNNNIAVQVEAEQDVVAFGFPNEYFQVMLNILNNAKDAMLSHEMRRGEIRIAITRCGEQAEVTIRDNAGGIPEDILPKIFDPYFTTREKGTGIGLYMSKIIIENNMGGHLNVRNVEDGAEFSVTCPVGEGNA
ncbi:MAG: response regulator [Sulfuricella sp.]|nr:response regulator [Sulfuricella sp.]